MFAYNCEIIRFLMTFCFNKVSIFLPPPTKLYEGNITARKQSLGQGNVFTPVCHSVHMGVHSRGGVSASRGVCMGGCLNPGRVGQTLPPSTAISGQYASYWNASLFQKRMSFCPGGGDFPSGQRPTLPRIETSLPD